MHSTFSSHMLAIFFRTMQMIACFLLDFSAAGVPVQHLSTFLAELKPHLPWFQGQNPASGPSTVATNGASQRHLASTTKTNDHASTNSAIIQHQQREESDGEEPDWFVSLQTEGASAVWAAIDLLLQVQHANHASLAASPRTLVAVGAMSYHGPLSSSMGGGATPLPGAKVDQVTYPVPSSLEPRQASEPQEAYEVGLYMHTQTPFQCFDGLFINACIADT